MHEPAHQEDVNALKERVLSMAESHFTADGSSNISQRSHFQIRRHDAAYFWNAKQIVALNYSALLHSASSVWRFKLHSRVLKSIPQERFTGVLSQFATAIDLVDTGSPCFSSPKGYFLNKSSSASNILTSKSATFKHLFEKYTLPICKPSVHSRWSKKAKGNRPSFTLSLLQDEDSDSPKALELSSSNPATTLDTSFENGQR